MEGQDFEQGFDFIREIIFEDEPVPEPVPEPEPEPEPQPQVRWG